MGENKANALTFSMFDHSSLRPCLHRKQFFVVVVIFTEKDCENNANWFNKNVLGYCRNLGSLRYGNEYCVEFDPVWEKLFFPLQLKSISITQL